MLCVVFEGVKHLCILLLCVMSFDYFLRKKTFAAQLAIVVEIAAQLQRSAHGKNGDNCAFNTDGRGRMDKGARSA